MILLLCLLGAAGPATASGYVCPAHSDIASGSSASPAAARMGLLR